jgi:hypothetical protein
MSRLVFLETQLMRWESGALELNSVLTQQPADNVIIDKDLLSLSRCLQYLRHSAGVQRNNDRVTGQKRARQVMARI